MVVDEFHISRQAAAPRARAPPHAPRLLVAQAAGARRRAAPAGTPGHPRPAGRRVGVGERRGVVGVGGGRRRAADHRDERDDERRRARSQTWLLDAQRHEARLDRAEVARRAPRLRRRAPGASGVTRGPTDACGDGFAARTRRRRRLELAAVDRIVVARARRRRRQRGRRRLLLDEDGARARRRARALARRGGRSRGGRRAAVPPRVPGGPGRGSSTRSAAASASTTPTWAPPRRPLRARAFTKGELRVIVATTTLGARRQPAGAPRRHRDGLQVGGDKLEKDSYLQMGGRAGRTGLSGEGEAFLLCQSKEVDKVRRMVCGPMPEAVAAAQGAAEGAARGEGAVRVAARCCCSSSSAAAGARGKKRRMMLVARVDAVGHRGGDPIRREEPKPRAAQGPDLRHRDEEGGPSCRRRCSTPPHEALNQIGYAEPSKKGPRDEAARRPHRVRAGGRRAADADAKGRPARRCPRRRRARAATSSGDGARALVGGAWRSSRGSCAAARSSATSSSCAPRG